MESVLVISSHGDLGGAPTVAIGIANLLKRDFHFEFLFGTTGGSSEWSMSNNFSTKIIPSLKTGKLSLLLLPITILKVVRIALRSKVKILHCHSFIASVATRIASLITNKACVYTVHGWPWRGQPVVFKAIIWLLELVVTLLSLKSRNCTIYVCNHVLKTDPFRFLRKNSYVIYNCSKIDLFNICQNNFFRHGLSSYTHDDKKVYALLLARFSKCKGYDILFKAINRLPVDIKFSILLVGSMTDSDYIKSLAHKLCPNHLRNLEFVGQVSNPLPYLQQADFIIVPSRFEAFPLSILDSLYLNKPVVATSVGGIPELIKDGFNGLLVKPGSSISLASRINQIATDKHLLTQLQSNSFGSYLDAFSSSHFAQNYKNCYNNLLI